MLDVRKRINKKKNFQIYFDFSKQNILVPFPSRYGDILEWKVKVFDTQLCLTSSDPMDYIAHQAPLFMEFSMQEYLSGLPFPSPGDLPNPGI